MQGAGNGGTVINLTGASVFASEVLQSGVPVIIGGGVLNRGEPAVVVIGIKLLAQEQLPEIRLAS
jgi:hypothetical protein